MPAPAAYAALEAPHRQVHQNGIEAVRRFENGDLDGTLACIAAVETASAEVVRLLDELDRGTAAIAAPLPQAAGF